MITVQPIYEYEIDYVKVGQRIKQARLENNMSQAELGEKIGCSNNHMSHVEIGQTKPSLPMILKLSLVLNKSLDYFFLDTPFTQNEIIINTSIFSGEKDLGKTLESLAIRRAMTDSQQAVTA